jgi:hypothetical protein
MTALTIFLFLAVAGLSGAMEQAPAGHSRGGRMASIARGSIGSVPGPWLARGRVFSEFVGIRFGSETVPLIWCILGLPCSPPSSDSSPGHAPRIPREGR